MGNEENIRNVIAKFIYFGFFIKDFYERKIISISSSFGVWGFGCQIVCASGGAGGLLAGIVGGQPD